MGALPTAELFEIQKHLALAPDGLPWPPGYFDRTPRKTFEAALSEYGVRPNHYLCGWPVYTEVEMARSEFRSAWSDEPPEILARWEAEGAEKPCESLEAD